MSKSCACDNGASPARLSQGNPADGGKSGQFVWQDWITVTGVNPHIEGIRALSCPSARLLSTAGVDGLDITVLVTAVRPAMTTGTESHPVPPKLVFFSSTGGSQYPVNELDLAVTTASPLTFTLLKQPGELTLSTGSGTAVLGELLGWSIVPPDNAEGVWAVTLTILVTPRPAAGGRVAPWRTPWTRAWDTGYITIAGKDGEATVQPNLFGRLDTSGIDALLLEVEVTQAKDANVQIVQSSEVTSDYLTVVGEPTLSGTTNKSGRGSFLLTRDAGATEATALRNLVFWEVAPSADDYLITFRIVASPAGRSGRPLGRR